LYKRINFLERKINSQNEVLENHREFFNFIYQYKDIKAVGVQRNVQLHVLAMLKFIISICEKNDLVYWLDCGTLIGALRHKGFIPWDDEADICMPRKDHQKLVDIILEKLETNEELRERIYIRRPFIAFRDTKTINKFPYPEIQLVNKVPFANVDVHIADYYDIDLTNMEPLYKNANFYINIRNEFANVVKKGEYDDLEETFMKYCKKSAISFEETEFIGASLDSRFKSPLHVTEIFPLKKVPFEDLELNIPKEPFNYLYHSYYKEDVMKLPRLIEDHNRKEIVSNQLKDKDIDEEYKKTIGFWDNLSEELKNE
jgi:lipopolysaccharide cholinephosphotransferase